MVVPILPFVVPDPDPSATATYGGGRKGSRRFFPKER